MIETDTKKIHLRNQKGFTLIEMISAIILLGVMGLFSIQFLTGAAQTNRLVAGQKALVDDAKLAMEFLLRELRVASEGTTASPTLITFTDTGTAASITFYKFSGLTVDTSTGPIIYSWSGSTLTRQSTATTTLATQVTDFSITETTTAGSKYYTFSLTLQGSNGESFTLESGVRPRSLIS